MKNILEIDGSYGEGGGQIIRTRLALSLITQKSIRIINIRAGRNKPGLLRQHLTCVKAAQAVSNAKVTGAELGSAEITFTPKQLKAGDYTFDIGSAGSTTLVLQTVLPALMLLNEPSTVTIKGGTHNPLAPPIIFLQNTYIPFLSKLGFDISLNCTKAGFAPLGGGEIVCEIRQRSHEITGKHKITERGSLQAVDAYSIIVNVPYHVAERELESITEYLNTTLEQIGGVRKTKTVEYKSISQGNMAVISVHSENFTETFSLLGNKKTSAEAIAKRLAGQVKRYLKNNATTDEYSADQILLPLALCKGGSFTTRVVSEHTLTHAYIIEKFLNVQITIKETENLAYIYVEVS